MTNAINWFEIPVTDMQRARAFYNELLQIELKDSPMEMEGMEMAMFPMGDDDQGVGGALVAGEQYQPKEGGTLVYLNVDDDIDGPLARLASAGGKVVMPKFQVSPEIGHIAIIRDSEGNHVGLHTPK